MSLSLKLYGITSVSLVSTLSARSYSRVGRVTFCTLNRRRSRSTSRELGYVPGVWSEVVEGLFSLRCLLNHARRGKV
jgi:hypothetical protein